MTIGEVFFNKGNFGNYKLFLEKFVDGDTSDTQFSKIAQELHFWRNVIAHVWLNSQGYEIEYDYQTNFGWEKKGGLLVINPKIYCEHYLKAFSEFGKIWKYDKIFSEEELENIKLRIIEKYKREE